jgi:hypothetical protein
MIWAHDERDATIAAGVVNTIPLLDDFEAAYGAQLLGATVMRIRGLVMATPAGTPATDCDWTGAIVVAPESSTAAALDPVASTTATTGYLSWMWRGYVCFTQTAAASRQFGDSLFSTGNSGPIDVRAKRRIDELGDRLFFVHRSTGAVVNWTTKVRLDILIALP